jgi:hypothetical protein
VGVAAVVLLSACGPAEPPEDAGGGAGEQMLANLPSCDRVPVGEEPEVEADVDGLVLPEGARVTSVVQQGPLTSISGSITMTPLEVRADYEGRQDVDLLRVEDEVFETEVLLRAEGRRMYLMAAALCATASDLNVIIGPDTDDAGLPQFQSDL